MSRFSYRIIALCLALVMLSSLNACTFDGILPSDTTADSSADTTASPTESTPSPDGSEDQAPTGTTVCPDCSTGSITTPHPTGTTANEPNNSATADPSDNSTTPVTPVDTTEKPADTTEKPADTTTVPVDTTAPAEPEGPKYTLVFETNSGDPLSDVELTFEELSVFELPTPVRLGYEFVRWCSDEGLTSAFTVPQAAPAEDTTLTLYAQWEVGVYTVNVSFNRDDHYRTSGGALTQKVTIGSKKFKEITVSTDLGYKVAYYEVNGNKYTSSTISLGNVYKDTTVNVVIDYATDELPIVNIEAAGEINSRETYTAMTCSIENCESELSGVTGGIRLRGNSTMNDTFIKKRPYRIKFDKKQSLFGLTKAKSWVLLADYLDPSTLHNDAALTLGNASDIFRFTPTSHKVNVYINGSYEGVYTLCEQIQENPGRLDIEIENDVATGFLPATLTDLKDYNFLICMNQSVAEGDDTEEYNETYFRAHRDGVNYYFEIKYPEKENFATEEQFKNYFDQLKAYVRYLFHDEDGAVPLMDSGSYEELSAVFDMQSLADYYIVDSIMMEKDHKSKSFNMFYTAETGKIHFGPIWDYDYCLNLKWSFYPNTTYTSDYTEIYYSNHFFKMIERFPELQEIVKQRYAEVFEPALTSYIAAFDGLVGSMKESLELNRQRWYLSYSSDIVDKNISFMKQFLKDRKSVLDDTWQLSKYKQ